MFRLKEVLKQKGVTSMELAHRLGICPAAMSHYITGKTSPTLALMEQMAESLNIDIVELIRPTKHDLMTPRKPAKSKADRQHDTHEKIISFCQYYHGESAVPGKYTHDESSFYSEEKELSYDDDLYLYSGKRLRQEFYMRITAAFLLHHQTNYRKYMETYFAFSPKILADMYAHYGTPEEVSARACV